MDRRDKYQRKLLWFWAEIGYDGERNTGEEERLTRETELGDDLTKACPLGLSKGSGRGDDGDDDSEEFDPPTDDEDIQSLQEDEDEMEDDDEEEGSGNRSKRKPRRKAKKAPSFEEELPEEASVCESPHAFKCPQKCI